MIFVVTGCLNKNNYCSLILESLFSCVSDFLVDLLDSLISNRIFFDFESDKLKPENYFNNIPFKSEKDLSFCWKFVKSNDSPLHFFESSIALLEIFAFAILYFSL